MPRSTLAENGNGDRLWVWGNVFESDLDLVRLGQSWEIRFPFLESKLQGRVEYISNRVDPNSHAVRVRTSIPNPELAPSSRSYGATTRSSLRPYSALAETSS